MAIGVPVVRPSNTPDRMRTSSGSCRCVVKRDWPGRRRSSQGWMSASDSAMRGGQPSTTQPIAGPWLSPQVVTRNRWPKLLWDTGASAEQFVQCHRAGRRRQAVAAGRPSSREGRFNVHRRRCRQDRCSAAWRARSVAVPGHGSHAHRRCQFAASRAPGQPSALSMCTSACDQQRFDGVQLFASHALDFLDDVLPSRAAHSRARPQPPAQQRSLAFAPKQDVVIVEVAHALTPSTMAMSGAAGFFMPTIW